MAKKLKKLDFKVDDEQELRIREAATKAGMSVSEYVRARVGEGAPVDGPVIQAGAAEIQAERVTINVYSLDDLGDDPLRAGDGSQRR